MIEKYEVLFICASNVGRSQIAEGFYNFYSGNKKAINAAGINREEDFGEIIIDIPIQVL